MNARCLLAVAVSLICLRVGMSGEAKKSADAKNIQGTWKFVSFDFPSANMKPEEVAEIIKKARVKITATEMTFAMEGEKKEERIQYRLYRDRAKVMDRFADTIVRFNGIPMDVRQWWPGIYELNGDFLKICYTDSSVSREPNEDKLDPARIERARPKEFKATQKTAIMILKRDK